jgi:hypothetical protein
MHGIAGYLISEGGKKTAQQHTRNNEYFLNFFYAKGSM